MVQDDVYLITVLPVFVAQQWKTSRWADTISAELKTVSEADLSTTAVAVLKYEIAKLTPNHSLCIQLHAWHLTHWIIWRK